HPVKRTNSQNNSTWNPEEENSNNVNVPNERMERKKMETNKNKTTRLAIKYNPPQPNKIPLLSFFVSLNLPTLHFLYTFLQITSLHIQAMFPQVLSTDGVSHSIPLLFPVHSLSSKSRRTRA